MSGRKRYRRLGAYLEGYRVPYYALVFLVALLARVGYAAITAEPLADGLRYGVVFATAFVLTTALLGAVLD